MEAESKATSNKSNSTKSGILKSATSSDASHREHVKTLNTMIAEHVNINQFYPDVSLPEKKIRDENQEARNDSAGSTWGTMSTSSNVYQDQIMGDDQQQSSKSRIESASKNVRFDEAEPLVSLLNDNGSEYDEEDSNNWEIETRPSSMGDSISLPTVSPGPSRETGSAETFTTQVDEETLAAARVRQKRRERFLEENPIEPDLPVLPSMSDYVNKKAEDHFERGLFNMRIKRYENAILCFNKTLGLTPRRYECYIHRAEAYLNLADFQSAILNYKRVCVLFPDEKQHYLRLAFIYFFQGQCLFDQKLYAEALESFTRASEMRPDVIGYHTRSIACLAALERHGECLALVNKRLETEDKNADLYVMRARLHQMFKNTTLCYYDVKDALALDSNHSEAKKLMAQLEESAEQLKQQAIELTITRKHREAMQKISLAVDTNPSKADFHIIRGALHRRLKDFNAAIDDYLLGLDKVDHDQNNPVYKDANRQLLLTYNDFAVECFTKELYDEAITLLNKAIKDMTNEKGLYINRGDCFYKQNHLHFAMADYCEALEMDNKDNNIKSRIAVIYNEYGLEDFQDKNYSESAKHFTSAIENNPLIGKYYASRSKSRMVLEVPDYSGARDDLLMCMLLDPSSDAIVPLITRLYPGKSVRDVMSSEAAITARKRMNQLVTDQREGNILSGSDVGCLEAQSNEDDIISTWKEGHVLPDLKACMRERDFNIYIAQEKRQITDKVKTALNNRASLRYTGARVMATSMVPTPPSKPRKSTVKESLAVKQKLSSTGWKKFSLGIGMNGGSVE